SFVLNSLSQLALIAFFAAASYNPLKLLKGKNFMYGVVYKITNKLNGRSYVGKTTRSVEERFGEHARCKKFLVDKAICKYGRENFLVEVIEECETIEQLNEREIFWIAELNCKVPNGYNLTDGGEGNLNPSAETRTKMSAARSGENHPMYGKHHKPETLAKMSATRRGKHLSEAARAKLSIAKKGVPKSPEHKAKLAAANTGKRATDETRAKMSAERKGVPKSAEHRAKIGAGNRGKNRGKSPFVNLLNEIDAHKLTYFALAEILGISVTTISQKLRRERNFTERDKDNLEKFFGKPADYLLKYNF
ncbi:MAG: GIY-YIG nuclease family protein, partial [Selenomonadaceae bacterium]|nr:GIY-YIG nuclease family protein [Selenomonadaceae bacterium]